MDAANPHHHHLHRTAPAAEEVAVEPSKKQVVSSLLATAAKRPGPASGVENSTARNGAVVVDAVTASPSVTERKEKASPSRLPPASSEKNQPPPARLPISQDDILALPSTPSRLSLNATSTGTGSSATAATAAAKRHVSASRVRPSLGSTAAALGTPSTGFSKLSINTSSPQDGIADSKFSPAVSEISGAVVGTSSFDPAYFMGLLKDGTHCAPITLQNDREMQREFLKIKQGLANTGNWNVRISALHHLQKLCHGNLDDFDCGPLVKQQTDAVSTLITFFRFLLNTCASSACQPDL